jgi:hypothetical protein
MALAAGDSTRQAEADPGQWGIPDVLRRHPGWDEFQDFPRVEHLYIIAARSTPNLRLYQFDHAHDERQRFYMELDRRRGA